MQRIGIVLLACAAATLWGCGGGGGGGSDGGGSNRFVIHPDRTSVSFNFVQGDIPAEQNIDLTWTGTPPDPIFVGAIIQGTGLSPVVEVVITETHAVVSLNAAGRLAAGQYSGTVQLLACTDQACAQRVGGTPISISYSITVRDPVFTGPPRIEFNHTRWTPPLPPPPDAELHVNAAAGTWSVAAPPWISVSQTSGTGAATLAVRVNPTGITQRGLFQDKVTVTGTGGAQSTEVSVFADEPQIIVEQLTFAGINGSTIAAQTATVRIIHPGLVTLPMSVSTSAPWLTIGSATASASTTASGGISIGIDPSAGPLASGEYSGTVNVRLGIPVDATVVPIHASLSLTKATLTFTPDHLVLGGELGRTFPAVPVTLSMDTDARSHAWNVTGAPVWATLSDSSGTVNATPQQIQLTPHRLQSSPGTATAMLRFTSQVNGDTVTADLPVAFNLDEHRVLAGEDGVALVDVPGTTWDRLSHTVKVTDNFGLNTAWTAVADQPWLQVTSSGTNGSDLVITADTTGLGANQLSTATVTISTTDATVAGPDRIRVGLWVGSAAPSTPLARNAVDSFFWSAVADPIRPYVYAYEQGTTSLRVFNVYTGAELPRITGLPVAFLRAAFVSSDGSTYYIWGGNMLGFIPVDLDSGVVGAPIPSSISFSTLFDRFKYVRPNGVGLLLDNGPEVLLASSGEPLEAGLLGGFDVSGDSKRAFSILGTELIDFTSAGGGTFVRQPAASIPGFASDLIFRSNFDGSRVYGVEIQDPHRILVGNGLTGASLGTLTSGLRYDTLLVTRQGRIITVAEGPGDSIARFHAYAPDGAELVTPVVIGSLPGAHEGVLSATGDGNFGIAVSRTPDGTVHIVPLPH